MATSGDNSEANPFSFSNFVTKKDDKVVTTKDEEEEENPFSFESFNKTSKNKDKEPKKGSKNKKLLIVDDIEIMDDIFADLPSPGEHLKKSKTRTKVTKTSKKVNSSKTKLENTDSSTGKPDENLSENESESDSVPDSSEDLSASPQTETYVLPDPPTPPVKASNNNKDLLKELEQLKEQNTVLQNDIQKIKLEYQENSQNSDKKINNLRKDLERVRKKEAEDTQALEDVVRMVEENLTTTTARALHAETTVTKLREELKSLKEKQIPHSEYQNLQMEHYHLLNTINEKSKNAAFLMRTAADKTEPHIRQLQTGVSSLRFLANQFDDICMIAELPKVNKNDEYS